jgi:D-arginine utilization repressor
MQPIDQIVYHATQCVYRRIVKPTSGETETVDKQQKRNFAGDASFQPYFSIGEAIATLFHPYVEVVLHDLRSERIVRIWNSCTGRQVGDPSRLNRAQDQFAPDQPIFGPYEKALPSQGRTKSITAGLREPSGELIGFLCINVDVTLIDNVAATLSAFTSTQMKRCEPIYRNDLQQQINYLVRDYSLKVNKPIDHLNRQERINLVSLADQASLFQARNSIMLVAKAMHLSRASVYNLLAEANKQSQVNARSAATATNADGRRRAFASP